MRELSEKQLTMAFSLIVFGESGVPPIVASTARDRFLLVFEFPETPPFFFVEAADTCLVEPAGSMVRAASYTVGPVRTFAEALALSFTMSECR